MELKIARAVFVFREKSKTGTAGLIAILSLYVDDGLLFGDPADPRFQQVKVKVASTFNIKHWKSLGPEAVKHLGMQWQTFVEDKAVSLCIHMDEYIDGLKEKSLKIKGEPDRLLDAEGASPVSELAGEGQMAGEPSRP